MTTQTIPETHLSVTEWATIVMAVSTVVYTLGALLLWHTTNKAFNLSRMQLNMIEQQSNRQREVERLEYISTVHKNFRELFISILNDEKNLDILKKNLGSDTNEEVRKNYLASFLINNCYELFEINNTGLFDDDFWKRVEIDMRALFQWEFVRQRWLKILTIYSPQFQAYIEEKILVLDIK